MRVFLVRHGESLGNVDNRVYGILQDHHVPLTDLGHRQAEAAGKFLKEYLKKHPPKKSRASEKFNASARNNKMRIWHSPYKRTRQTMEGVVKGLGMEHVRDIREDYLLREQDFGIFSDIPDEKTQKKKFPGEFKRYSGLIKACGKVYARPPLGESRADVAQRVRIFIGSLMRDNQNGHQDMIVVSHSVTNRAIEMNFLHHNVEWFEKAPGPKNCDIVMIEGGYQKGWTATKIYSSAPDPAPTPKLTRKQLSELKMTA